MCDRNSNAGYAHGCRCDGCVDAHRAYHRTWRAKREHRTTDTAQLRAHVEALNAAGVSYAEIARIAGVARSTIDRLRAGNALNPTTAARLRAIEGRAVLPSTMVSREPLDRRIATLLANGVSGQRIAASGVPYGTVIRAWDGTRTIEAGRLAAYMAATAPLKATRGVPTPTRIERVRVIRAKWGF